MSGTDERCAITRERLLDAAAHGERAPDDAHLSGCASCQALAEALALAERALFEEDRSGTAMPEVEAALMARVRADLGRAPLGWAGSLGFGLVATAVALALLVSRGDAHHVAWVDLALCGAVWAVAFSASIHLVRSAIARQRSALWGLVGLGVAVGTVLVCPLPSAEVGCAACRSLPGGLTTSQSIGLFVLTGLLFGGLLTWAMQRSIAVADGSRTALAAIAVVAAVGPALYLTCTPFSVGSLVGLAAGVLGGALASAVGARVAMRAS